MVPVIMHGSGIFTLVAHSPAARGTKRAKKIFVVGAVAMAGIALLTALVIPTDGHLIALFGAGSETIRIGDDFFHTIASFYLKKIVLSRHAIPQIWYILTI